MINIIDQKAIENRKNGINKIKNYRGNFADEAKNIEDELKHEIEEKGIDNLMAHLRLCGHIPESYSHDSTEEKLYSKYTDILLSLTYESLGFKSIVFAERSDSADVEIFGKNFNFIADAKAFRLSRTAKNQKDFKIQAMDNWKRGKPYAMVVCPIYQLPNRSSQIYQQAITRNVCIFTYSHLTLLLNFSLKENKLVIENLLEEIFKVIPALNPSKNAVDYWLAVNKTILNFSDKIQELWQLEKQVVIESTKIAKEEALYFLASEREKIMKLSHEEALKELIKINRIDSRIKTIESIKENGLFSIQ
ncbi:HindIII family type II restriction endonuclease [Geminocystis herdmanii]|uniref:HindIII family type II restriction endonuclease n=1 Tax=Geminocystis herdmanii TaxID=669359 RepID=UPI0003469036|nr:HindIII family type II restriction endonuclease [Geminocystis herdmanii]